MNPESGGIGLLVYCVHSTSAPHALSRVYNTFYAGICQKKVPIVAVITELEREMCMENGGIPTGSSSRVVACNSQVMLASQRFRVTQASRMLLPPPLKSLPKFCVTSLSIIAWIGSQRQLARVRHGSVVLLDVVVEGPNHTHDGTRRPLYLESIM
ncbi:hypothetical protein BDR07DRAFT_692724 [Suillus spraguei]|nr:hypothetical protein BDR07DRAFT_692724 [Suillus spraguei]